MATPRYYLQGLSITTYDAEATGGTTYNNIVTSEIDDNGAFSTLGTVVSIRAYGYKDYIEGGSNALSEVAEKQFEGASRICLHCAGYTQIDALLFFNDLRPMFAPAYYSGSGELLSHGTSQYCLALPSRPDRFYVTPVWDGTIIKLYAATDPSFEQVSDDWPDLIDCAWTTAYNGGTGENIDWIPKLIEPVLFDGVILSPLPEPLLYPDGTGETGITVGAEAQIGSNIVADVSDDVKFQVVPAGAAWVDDDRQLIMADWATNAAIRITWDQAPDAETAITVVVGGWDNDGSGGDDSGGTGGDSGGTGGDGGDDSGGSDDSGETGTATAESLKSAYMAGLATGLALYSCK